jgi:ATP-dependent DNA helicase PIF1
LITDLSDADVTVDMQDGTEQTIQATLLYPKRKDVARNNDMKLGKLLKEKVRSKTFTAEDTVIARKSRMLVSMTEKHIKVINSCTNAIDKLVLCVGAQVMLVKNLDQEKQLVNGSRGVVTDIDGYGLPVVLFDNGEEMTMQYERFETESGDSIYTRKQIPLILGWALTIHKCQGTSLSSVITDLTEVFDEAQVYVTLSRARSIEGLFIVNLNYSKIKCNARVKKYYKALEERLLIK